MAVYLPRVLGNQVSGERREYERPDAGSADRYPGCHGALLVEVEADHDD